ncbi:MAG: VRR-NUC domain-containing protein, partial [Myxococcota bacterium]|nr:VRR-NUC domain-containing protein [Myxococcota bacterium]
HVIRALQAAPCQAQSLYARLLPRQPRLFWLDDLAYAEVEDPAAAADALQRAGLAWSAARIASPRRLAESSTVDQLRAACRAHGLRVSGRRSELIDRCAQPECARTLRRPGLELRHRTLFRSLMRLATLDHRGDLGRVVQARLGLFKPASYHPTGGAGLFPTRAAWRRYEQGLRLRALPVPPPSDQQFEWLETLPPPPPWRRRYSGRRFAETALRERLRTDERQCAAADSAASWKRMLDARPDAPGPVVARLALALGRAGRPSEAVALCDSWLPRLPPAEADAVERTARRLGRAAGRSHRPLVPLIQAPRRRLLLEPGTGRARRPRWRVGRHHYNVEVAVVETLSRHGRLAVRGEGVPWATLFGVCFRDVLFAPVPGMLPSPMLRAPLDLGTPGFRGRRESMIDHRLREIRSGDASHLIADVVARRGMEDIRGVDWKRFPPPTLIALARLVPGPALAAILEAFVDDWRGARRGLPDLCVLPGRPVRISRSRPGRLGAGLLLVEVKGPGDGLRPAQRVWLDRLIRAGVPAEVWEVRPDMGHGLPRVTADGTSPSRKEHA